MAQSLPLHATIAVVGTGAMGAGIAQVAAAAGHTVKLMDNRPQAAQAAVASIRAQFARLAEKGKLTQEAAHAASSRLVAVATQSELADASLVIEAIVDDCIFGTNTSSISVTAIGAALKHPGRLAGLHFFNPAPLMALVEVVSGLATDPHVAETLFATAHAWGKTPVHAKSTPGFIVNRVARPYYGEALRLLTEGAANCATIDAVMREAGGFRMGPFELMDMIGHDINFAVTCSVWSAFYNDPRFLPSLVQQELVNAGFLGKKSGRGFYDYQPGVTKPGPQTESPHPLPAEISICGESSAANALAQRLKTAHVAFRRDVSRDGRIAQAGGAVVFVTDGRSATQRASESGLSNTVVIDLALDYTQAKRLAMATSAQCTEAAANEATALLQGASLALCRCTRIGCNAHRLHAGKRSGRCSESGGLLNISR